LDRLSLIREGFQNVVHRRLQAEVGLRTLGGGGDVSAHLLWLDITSGDQSPWSQAELFRRHLGVPKAELLGEELPSPEAGSEEIFHRVRSETDRELRELMERWIALAESSESSPRS